MFEEQKTKSRIIPIYEYFEILQREWISADLRSKIFKRGKDKSFWKRVCDGKKNTIENIAIKNSLPTIFNDQDLYLELKKQIYREVSFPNFTYKDNADRLNQGPWDLYYYYYPSSEVRFDLFSESKVGYIKGFDSPNPILVPLSQVENSVQTFIPIIPSCVIVTVKDEPSKEYSLLLEKVTRIL